MTLFASDSRSAFDAREHAQWIAFAPAVFQAARVLCKSGILASVEAAGRGGLQLSEIVARASLSEYAVRVLMEAGLGGGLFTLNDERYATTKTAWFLLHDPLTRVNVDFMHEISYRGLFDLDAALESGEARGLATLGSWKTIYEGLAALPVTTRDAWLAFDHYYSDIAFPAAWRLLADRGVRRVMDIGGNTGKFAAQVVSSDSLAESTIVDLPAQLDLARAALHVLPASARARVRFHAADMLARTVDLPREHDAVWMSQFLACFDEAQIVAILRAAASALPKQGHVYILEPFWDRQEQRVAAFCMQQTSLYFAAIANGNSRMYTFDVMHELVERAGLRVSEVIDDVGLFHTLLICERAETAL